MVVVVVDLGSTIISGNCRDSLPYLLPSLMTPSPHQLLHQHYEQSPGAAALFEVGVVGPRKMGLRNSKIMYR